MKLVSPYRVIRATTKCHEHLAAIGFDWVRALEMLAHSAKKYSKAETFAITNQTLRVPHYAYQTREESLMIWILEISLAYLRSDDFDQDTVMISPDTLVLMDLKEKFCSTAWDLGVIVRPHPVVPILNFLQFWPHHAKEKLIRFYTRCLHIGQGLDHHEKKWGGDTTPLIELLEPVDYKMVDRAGMRVRMWAEREFISRVTYRTKLIMPKIGTVVDFRYFAKKRMVEVYEELFK